ncbi:riboflavin kinase [Thermothelomyces heterothallicus CBS 202.75]|uniref:riboflavin kinase n=1 Tax=Thermothelomyces heterothallicus CBS 202.75 TaxID=1149848 RepID=UPI00374329CF
MAAPTPNRPAVVGDPSGPEAPYPLQMSGLVISGFGRGSKELGIPTANLPVDDTKTPWIASTPSGVYFGWASLRLPPSHPDYRQQQQQQQQEEEEEEEGLSGSVTGKKGLRGRNGFTVYPMVMSIGYNPFYKNTVRSAEVHVLHAFSADFYGVEMRLLITGFIRDEKDYSGLDALVADINFDCDVAKRSLAREAWAPSGLDVEVDLPGNGDGGTKVLRGTLDCGWLIRPSELVEGKGE